jgi:hypothetical protein
MTYLPFHFLHTAFFADHFATNLIFYVKRSYNTMAFNTAGQKSATIYTPWITICMGDHAAAHVQVRLRLELRPGEFQFGANNL